MADSKENMASGFNFLESSTDRMWDMCKASWEGLNWTSDQLENMARKQMDQNKAMRDECMKMTADLGKQMRGSQEQYWKMVKEAMTGNYKTLNLSDYYNSWFKK